MQKIKIYMDTLVFGLQKMGGVSVVWYEYIKRMLNDPDIELTLLDINGDYVNFLYNELDTSNARHIKEAPYNLQILRNIKPKFEVPSKPVIFQSTYLRTCKRKNVKNVVMVHDITHQLYFNGIKKGLNTFQKMKSIKNSDGIVCVSQNTLNDLHNFFPHSKRKKTTVVYNSASEEYKKIDSPIIPEKYNELKNKKYFIYVGDRFLYKNTRFLIEILKRKNDIDCVFIGGRDFDESEIKLMHGVYGRIHRFTKVSNEDLNLLYNCAFCMIFPSLYEGFGIPVLEAMKAGCPVVAFNNSSIPEVMRGTGFMLKNNDMSGTLNVLKQLENPKVKEKIIKEELSASNYFNWDKSYGSLKEFYIKVMGI